MAGRHPRRVEDHRSEAALLRQAVPARHHTEAHHRAAAVPHHRAAAAVAGAPARAGGPEPAGALAGAAEAGLVGAEVAERRSFADHHRYGVQECRDLMEQAEKAGLMLATTVKDFVRLNQAGPEQQKLLESSEILYVDLEFENSKTVESMLQETIRRAEEFRLSNG